ncbi:hypothetical protein GCM10023259_087160 [Thermocatellispora tengchongensis]
MTGLWRLGRGSCLEEERRERSDQSDEGRHDPEERPSPPVRSTGHKHSAGRVWSRSAGSAATRATREDTTLKSAQARPCEARAISTGRPVPELLGGGTGRSTGRAFSTVRGLPVVVLARHPAGGSPLAVSQAPSTGVGQRLRVTAWRTVSPIYRKVMHLPHLQRRQITPERMLLPANDRRATGD